MLSYLPSLSPIIIYFSSIEKFSINDKSRLLSNSEDNDEFGILKSNAVVFIELEDSGDVGDQNSGPLFSDSMLVSTKDKYS